MEELVDDKKLSSDFFKLQVEQNEDTYEKSYFDEVNASLIFEQLKEPDDDKDDLALVVPNDPTVLLTVVVESLLALLKYDVSSGSKSTLSTIKPGDSVGLIQNRIMYPGEFKGMEIIHGNEYYCVKRLDMPGEMVEKIPKGRGREWRIQPYSSTEDVTRARRTKVYGKNLERMLDLPIGGIKAFQKSKMLVVAPDKSKLIEAIRGVKIGGDPLEAIFPIADYKSTEDWHYVGSFGLNNLKQEPIISLVATCDMAVDIALTDPSYKLLLIDGSVKLRSHYGSIERLNADVHPRKILALLNPVDEEEIQTLKSMGVHSFVWKRQDFKNVQVRSSVVATNKPFIRHSQTMQYLGGEEPLFHSVNLPDEIEGLLDDSYRKLYELSKKINPLPEAGILIRWGISILNSWLQLPLTANAFHKYLEDEKINSKRLDERLSDFKQRLRESYGLLIPAMYSNDCEKLLSDMDKIYEYFSVNNPKQEFIKGLFNSESDRKAVYCCLPQYTSALNSVINDSDIIAKNVEQIDSSPVECGIVTGWSNRRNIARCFLAPIEKLHFVLYKKEGESVRSVYRSHSASPQSVHDTAIRKSLGLDTPYTHVDSHDTQNLDSIVSFVNRKFDVSAIHTNYLPKGLSGDETVEARQIVFEDDSVLYADDSYHLDKIDRQAHRINRSTPIEVGEGDELVFADSERSMFEELLRILQESDEYKQISSVAQIWRQALIDYVERENVSEQQLSDMFKLVGCPRSVAAIRSWLNGSVIGPSGNNYEAIHAIAKITKDAKLNENIDEVIRACKTVHVLHVRTGWLLVRNIINSAVMEQDDDEIDEATKRKLEAYSGSARLLSVKHISENKFDVPRSQVGKLIEVYA